MKNVANLVAVDVLDDPVAEWTTRFELEGVAGVEAFGAAFSALEHQLDDDRLRLLAIQAAAILLDAIDVEGGREPVFAAIRSMPPPCAALASDLLLLSNFGDRDGALSELDDATILCLACLTATAGQHEQALGFLSEAVLQRSAPAFRRAVFAARCFILGHACSIGSLWIGRDGGSASLDEVEEALSSSPLDVRLYRRRGRLLAEDGNIKGALEAFAVGLALPIDGEDRAVLGEDLAVVAAFQIMRGEEAVLDMRRLRLALAACKPATLRAEAVLAKWPGHAAAQVVDQHSRNLAVRYFRDNVWHADAVGASAYPTLFGKTYIDTIWLEITNHCNQKCTFCPDMFREDARTWLPLDQVKRLLDEIAETFMVGSMQLNAYGEPLIHPNIKEILAYIREKQLPWPTFFTSHGMTLVDKKLQQLSHNYPTGIAISLHNDNQQSYALTRSAKIGDYDTLVTRVSALLRQMVHERAPTHLRLYQMVCNGREDMQVDPQVRAAFPDSPERMMAHLRKWEAIAAEIAAAAPPEAEARALVNAPDYIAEAFFASTSDDGYHMPVLEWTDEQGRRQRAFMSARPVGTYANLLLEYHPEWEVERKVVSSRTCGYFANTPSLAIFATGKLGICCLDMNSTATFGALSDFGSLQEALNSPAARRMFAQLSNGVAVSRGCQICLGSGKQMCGSRKESQPAFAPA